MDTTNETTGPASPAPLRRRRRGVRTVPALALLAAMLAAGLAAPRLRPVRCDGCGQMTIAFRAERLLPGWKSYCPNPPITGERPLLCPACFGRVLDSIPSLDPSARQAVALLLTDRRARWRMDRAVERAISGPKVPTAQFPPAKR